MEAEQHEYHIPLGGDCSVAFQLRELKLRKTALPFDWSKCKISQLIDALKDNLSDFANIQIVKQSINHPFIPTETDVYDEKNEISTSSYIVKNRYGITFAHELTNPDKISHYQSRINERILRFNKLLDVSKEISSSQESTSYNIHFIRKEFEKINSTYLSKLLELIKILGVIEGKNKMTLVCHYTSLQYLKELQIPNLRIIYYKEFDADWKCPNLEWPIIFAWKEFPEPLVL